MIKKITISVNLYSSIFGGEFIQIAPAIPTTEIVILGLRHYTRIHLN